MLTLKVTQYCLSILRDLGDDVEPITLNQIASQFQSSQFKLLQRPVWNDSMSEPYSQNSILSNESIEASRELNSGTLGQY